MEKEVHFYRSIVANIVTVLGALALNLLSILIMKLGFNIKDGLLLIIGIAIFAVINFLFMPRIIFLIQRKPYIKVTKDELIIHSSHGRSVPIKWKDIQNFELSFLYFNRIIEIKLYDEEKYRPYMPILMRKKHVEPSLISPFRIVWWHIKRRDRERLIHRLDEWTPHVFLTLEEMIKEAREEEQQTREINKEYFLKQYRQSFIIAVAVGIFFSVINELEISLLIVYFFLYPFAKVISDLLFGFKFKYKYWKNKLVLSYIDRLYFVLMIFVYLFSPVIAPLGGVYLIGRELRRLIKRLKQ